MGSALETLCGQAFGAGQVYLLGVYMQRSWIIPCVTCIILFPIYIFATPTLKLLGHEDDVSDIAGNCTIFDYSSVILTSHQFPCADVCSVLFVLCFSNLYLGVVKNCSQKQYLSSFEKKNCLACVFHIFSSFVFINYYYYCFCLQ